MPVHAQTYSHCDIKNPEKRYNTQYFEVGKESASIPEAMWAKTWGK